MHLGLLTLHIHLPGCKSLKQKRSRIKPLIIRMQREFNISVAEVDYLDKWQDSIIACALVSNDNGHTQRSLQKIIYWLETYWPDVDLINEQIEIIL
jgi:uncharacterized protein YlxP (DUF503 family)